MNECPQCGRSRCRTHGHQDGVNLRDEICAVDVCCKQGGHLCVVVRNYNTLIACLRKSVEIMDEEGDGYRSPDNQARVRTIKAVLAHVDPSPSASAPTRLTSRSDGG